MAYKSSILQASKIPVFSICAIPKNVVRGRDLLISNTSLNY